MNKRKGSTPNISKRDNISVVFNYSSIELTESMERLLNRGLNFAILPLKLDLTQVLVDFRKFERSAIWHEFWFGNEQNNPNPPIFKSKKKNMPKNYTVPEGLKVFLNAVKSEILDPRNRNRAKCNLPDDEMQSLKTLIKLQKDRVIIIKPCDKGAGLIILNFVDYMTSCYEQLLSKLTFENGQTKRYYQEVHDSQLAVAKLKIMNLLEYGLNENIITNQEFEAMNPTDKDPAKFYQIFKIHKQHEPNRPPPPRVIISGSGSIGENCGKYVDHHIKHIQEKYETFIQDTPDWLREVEKINSGPELPLNSILVTWDVVGLFTNIPTEEGLRCLKIALESRKNQNNSTDFLVRLMEVILKNNLFKFNGEMFRQEIGAAMGSPPIPAYANIFMAETMDNKIKELAEKYQENNQSKMLAFKRFLDDYISIFAGSSQKLHELFEELNRFHPTIKLTMNHTTNPNEPKEDRCDCEQKSAIPFLDTSISIKNRRLDTDLYRKETDRNQYLLLSSCHPAQVTKSVPFSLALRIVRICSDFRNREKRFSELTNLLLSRGYSQRMVDAAVDRARKIPRKVALRKVSERKLEKRPVFALTFDPRLPSIPSIQAKHWRSMVFQDPYLGKVFTKPPLTGFKRNRNIRDHLVRAQVPPRPRPYPQREIPGMKKCGQSCPACPYIKEGKEVNINHNEWKIMKSVNCNTYNVVYLIKCKKNNCKENFYIGETGRFLKKRLSEHIGYITNKITSQATGEHFNLPGHSTSDLTVTILELVKRRDDLYRKEREKYFIRKFNAYHNGINRQK